MDSPGFLIRARVVVPVSQPPIHDGAVFVVDDRIQAVGPWHELASRSSGDTGFVDLTDQIILPGLVNAHCHLDYTRMAGGIPPTKSFSDWIKGILAYKADWSYTDFAESWVAGASMLLRNGTTTVLDIEAVPELLEEAWSSTPLRVVSALEMTGVRSGRSAEQILHDTIEAIPDATTPGNSIALSPHSLYATKPDLVQLAATEARQRNWPLTMHVSESEEEQSMFTAQDGPMFDWLQSQRDMSDCDGKTPVQRLHRLGVLSDQFIAVHGNCLTAEDIALLAQHRCSVVHCPRSHAYFQHPRFPLETLVDAGVNVCLGTDSLASVRGTNRSNIELNLFTEMQALANAIPDLEPEQIIAMATHNGAKAMGCESEFGHLAPSTSADLIALPAPANLTDPYDAILQHQGPASAVFIRGQQVCATGQ